MTRRRELEVRVKELTYALPGEVRPYVIDIMLTALLEVEREV